ncbi:MAG: UDP-4-amino-4,6-dideoxy-N-acetyl-beta-L-altrosamine transaminase [Gammaproteobacteria bacterium]
MIPYGRQTISADDRRAVDAVLCSDFLTQGPAVPAFEAALAAYCGAAHAVATANATSALHLACRVLGIGPGDRVWTSSNTFVASANCALYCGASVDFVDIDPVTYNLSVERLEEKLDRARMDGTLPKAVIPVHFAGQSCPMREISALAKRYGFRIIEDASHAVGGDYLDAKIGSCRYSDMTVFSFHPVKIITTGEGGMLLTNDTELAERAALLRSHGITRDATVMTENSHGDWYYQQLDLGYNYRLTDLQAALGLSQLQSLDAFIARRREIAELYDRALSDLPLLLPRQHADGRSAWHLYVVQLQLQHLHSDKATLFRALKERGIGVNVHYIPVHTQPYYQRLGFKAEDFPESVAYYRAALTIPLYAHLSPEQQQQVIAGLTEVLR